LGAKRFRDGLFPQMLIAASSQTTPSKTTPMLASPLRSECVDQVMRTHRHRRPDRRRKPDGIFGKAPCRVELECPDRDTMIKDRADE